MYNFSKNEFGQTQYEVTYQRRSLMEKSSPSSEQWVTALTYTHTGSEVDEYIYLDTDLDSVPPGLWDVRVVVRDLQSDTSVHADESFRVLYRRRSVD